jgi:two-component system repressor protein LuxO
LSQQEIEGITSQMATAQTASIMSIGGIVIDRVRPLALVEREVIEHAINHCDGNIPKAAAMLEVSPSTIYRKKQAWG